MYDGVGGRRFLRKGQFAGGDGGAGRFTELTGLSVFDAARRNRPFPAEGPMMQPSTRLQTTVNRPARHRSSRPTRPNQPRDQRRMRPGFSLIVRRGSWVATDFQHMQDEITAAGKSCAEGRKLRQTDKPASPPWRATPYGVRLSVPQGAPQKTRLNRAQEGS